MLCIGSVGVRHSVVREVGQTIDRGGEVLKQVTIVNPFYILWLIMSVLKSVIITLPKGVPSKTPGVISATELTKSVPKLNFSATLLTDKTRMDPKKMTKHEEIQDDGSSFKTDVCVRGKKRRLDHLTWEEKLQRKYADKK